MDDYRFYWTTVTTTAILAVYVLVNGAIMLWAVSPVAAIALVAVIVIGTQYVITSVG